MRKLSITEAAIIIGIAVGTFLFGLHLGNHQAEQNLYAMFSKLGTEATKGNEDAKLACQGLLKMKGEINQSKTSAHIYWLISLYGKDQ